jgi:hypothetical protein
VDEGKLLLFIKDEVTSRAPRRPRKGRRLDAERQRKRKAELPLQPLLPPKQKRWDAGAIPILEGDDDESCSDLVLMYNTVRGYCSAIVRRISIGDQEHLIKYVSNCLSLKSYSHMERAVLN